MKSKTTVALTVLIPALEMLTGAKADAAAVAAGEIKPGEHVPNDYWIQNDNPQKRLFDVSDSVAITTSTWISTSPWWIERDGPLVVKIDEQFLP